MEKKDAPLEPLKITYQGSLDGLSIEPLKQKVQELYRNTVGNPDGSKRSETAFLKEISRWEENRECTLQDLCVILGWYFHFFKEKDPSWKKADRMFSEEQKEQIQFPTWTKNGISYSPYGEEDYPKKSFPHWSKDPHSRY